MKPRFSQGLLTCDMAGKQFLGEKFRSYSFSGGKMREKTEAAPPRHPPLNRKRRLLRRGTVEEYFLSRSLAGGLYSHVISMA
jgi:hypothetical protein